MPRKTFFCINDNVPATTVELLSEACAARDVDYVEIDARSFTYEDELQLSGDGTELMYRPAVSMAAIRVEQFLFAPGVATFYAKRTSPFFDPLSSTLIHQRAGIPVPRTIYCYTTDRDLLRTYVRLLGGFPIVMKMSGYSSGIGVMRIDSYASLFSTLDFIVEGGRYPLLTSYIDDAIHWRVVVLGDRAIAAYRNVTEQDDFRTYGSSDPADFTDTVPERMAEIAVAAVNVLENEFGGVDILEHASGRYYLLEANFPCYFGTSTEVAGIDIAGPMIDYLLAKAKRIRREGKKKGEGREKEGKRGG